MKKLLITLLMITQTGFAVLAPLNQGAVEIKAILSDKQFQTSFGAGEVVQEIKKMPHGYLLRTSEHELSVEVEYLPQNHPGPQKFALHFQEPTKVAR